jgi:hypothetical protein
VLKVVSTTWPWNLTGFHLTVEQTVAHLVALGADEVCVRTPSYYTPYGTAFHLDLAAKARAVGMTVSLWPVISLYYPEKQAEAILLQIALFRPVRIVLDAEGAWVKDYGANTVRFLDALGNPGIPVGLGSYRRPDFHQDIQWVTWLRHKVDGVYSIAFQAPQMYPIGSNTVSGWLADFKASVDAHAVYEVMAGRTDIPWLPWMPAFIGGGYEGQTTPWVPQAAPYKAATDYLVGRLGDRLLGFNHWSLDKTLIDPRMKGVYDYIASYESGPAPTPPVPFLDRPESERWIVVREDLLKRGVIAG